VLGLARIYALLGDRGAAIDRLEHLLSIPMNLTPVILRLARPGRRVAVIPGSSGSRATWSNGGIG